MIALLKFVVMTVFNILPDSPFNAMVEELELERDFMQYLNWFIPLDIAGNMLLAWCDCLLVYLVFFIVWKIVTLLISIKLKGLFSFFKVIK